MNKMNEKIKINDCSSAERLFRDIGCIHADLIEEALEPEKYYNSDKTVSKTT